MSLEGLIHGGAYFRNFAVNDSPQSKHNKAEELYIGWLGLLVLHTCNTWLIDQENDMTEETGGQEVSIILLHCCLSPPRL